jgi:hypothetical protein
LLSGICTTLSLGHYRRQFGVLSSLLVSSMKRALPGRRRCAVAGASAPRDAPVVIPVVDMAIQVVVETDTGVGVPDHELIAERHHVLLGVPGITRLHAGYGGRVEQYE